MKVRLTLICFCVLSLQDGNTGISDAQSLYSGIEGGGVTVQCPSSLSDSRKFFCKEDCKQEDILIETSSVRAERGRYSIQWRRTGTSRGDSFASIKQLTKSDSGLYRCGIGTSGTTYEQMEIIVVDALLDGSEETRTLNTRTGGNLVVKCVFPISSGRKYFCREDCKREDVLVAMTGFEKTTGRYSIRSTKLSTQGFVYVSITQLRTSDSGRYRCAVDRPFSTDPYREFEISVSDAPNKSQPNLPLPGNQISIPSGSSTTTTITTTQIFSSEFDQQKSAAGTWLAVALSLGVLVVLVSVAVLAKTCGQRSTRPDGLQTRGNTDSTNMEVPTYENCPPPVSDESTYQSLDRATRDQNQTYCTLTRHT